MGTKQSSWDAFTPALAEWILVAMESMGFSKPTPVQASTIGLFSGHKDVVVEAVTGSGKTLAFLIPVAEKLLRLPEPLKSRHIGSIIISPTRELAVQIHSVLLDLLRFHGPSSSHLNPGNESFPASAPKVIPQLLIGGTVTPAQDLSFFVRNSPNLLIATPGRLVELLSSPQVHCSSLEVLVLDEADRLLDLGYKDDLQKILSRLPKQKRVGLFSASVSEAVSEIIRVGLRNPVKVTVRVKGSNGEKRTPNSLQLKYIITPSSHKIPAVHKLLLQLKQPPSKIILYVSTCAAVDYFQHTLPSILKPYSLVALHGKQPPAVRNKNFTRFVNSVEPTVLLTTDVASRGLDVPQVDVVIQLDPPVDSKTFLHRAGRAGRAGRRGLSVVMLQPNEAAYIPFLEIRKTPVSLFEDPAIEITDTEAMEITSKIRELVLSDRSLFDKGSKAFVSWVKAYSKNTASSIFRMADLDWTDLGNAWALIRLPKMPELKNWDGDRTLGVDVDMSQYAYKDPKREQARREAQEEAKNAGPYTPSEEQLRKKKKREAWSNKHDEQELREQRREKRKRKRDAEKHKKMAPEELEKEKELQALIEEVKKKRKAEAEEEFNGFPE